MTFIKTKVQIYSMQEEKHIAALREVKETIDETLEDRRGLLPRQRRLMSALSLGVQHVIEIWLHRSGAIKPGASVKHEWFQAGESRLNIRLAGILTKDIESLKGAKRVLALARYIEANRNDIVYGAPLVKDTILREKIEEFLELKKAVEEATGGIAWD
jgi:hypothetical protein